MRRRLVLLLPLLTGCNPLLTDQSVAVTSVMSVSAAEAVIYGGAATAAFLIIDPLAPNWEILEQKTGEGNWRVVLRRKRFATGGDGESQQVFRRQAEEIAQRLGSPGYSITGYTEGIDSETTIARRWARGSIELLPKLQAVKAADPAPTTLPAPTL